MKFDENDPLLRHCGGGGIKSQTILRVKHWFEEKIDVVGSGILAESRGEIARQTDRSDGKVKERVVRRTDG